MMKKCIKTKVEIFSLKQSEKPIASTRVGSRSRYSGVSSRTAIYYFIACLYLLIDNAIWLEKIQLFFNIYHFVTLAPLITVY